MEDFQKNYVLAVDDKPENLLAIEALLTDLDLEVVCAASGQEALALMLDYEFAVVLLDVQMPEMDGFEMAELMRANDRTKHIPIIFVTAINKEERHVFRGYEAGAVDYLFKPLEPEFVRSKVNVFLELYRQKVTIQKSAETLRRVNQQILDQQKSVIEEERLNLLLQMAGATAHELNQPLTVLLGNIELMGLTEHDSEQQRKHLSRINESGRRIADIIKKIQTIRHDEIKPHLPGTSIINLEQQIQILSVEDSDDDFELLNNVLRGNRQINLSRAKSIGDARIRLSKTRLDLIFLDYQLPDGNGLDFLRELDSDGCEVPVIIISDEGNEVLAAQLIRAGAYDYLTKDLVQEEPLSRIITTSLEKARLKKDIKIAQKKMVEMTTKDELTKLYNRRVFNETIERELSRAVRYETNLSLCMLDLDCFKEINDTHGHIAGDIVLIQVGRILEDSVRESDVCCRYGGDEFAIILPNTDVMAAGALGERVRRKVAEYQFQYNSTKINVTVSLGIVPFNCTVNSASQMIENADETLYRAKNSGKNKVVTLTG